MASPSDATKVKGRGGSAAQKRKTAMDVESTPKRKDDRQMDNGSAVADLNITLYPSGHKGPAYVSLNLKKQEKKVRNSQHLLNVARIVSAAGVGAEEIKPQGYGRFEVKFKTAELANNFTSSRLPEIKKLNPMIPRFRVQRRGLIRQISVDHDLQDLIAKSDSPCKIINARRLNRRQLNCESKQVEWVPSETVLLTFEGTVLPDSIKVYNLVVVPVEVYVEPPRTCFNCFRYGHSSKHCRSAQVCRFCGSADHCKEECPDKDEVKCLHCKGDHKTFDQSCKEFQIQQLISKQMAFSNVNFWEARDFVSRGFQSSSQVSKAPPLTIEHFPPLQAASQSSVMSLKSFGGQQRPAPLSAWSNSNSSSGSTTSSEGSVPLNTSVTHKTTTSINNDCISDCISTLSPVKRNIKVSSLNNACFKSEVSSAPSTSSPIVSNSKTDLTTSPRSSFGKALSCSPLNVSLSQQISTQMRTSSMTSLSPSSSVKSVNSLKQYKANPKKK
ncbi:uncharacterized protein LOC143266321 [Megachile rotundata]|uniref:uncharacterized protein LOC143266321 n=1 Tax=Megachile rotundata TaxID=143995 RepID=UPI003FD3004F